MLVACLDKAKADYDKCVDRDKSYDVKGAVAACSAAVAADPKSPSGQAAAKKLYDLQLVSDKIKTEAADKAARDAKIDKDEPLVVAAPSATQVTVADSATAAAVATTPGDVVGQAQALFQSGDLAGARALLEPRVLGTHAKPTLPEGSLLEQICMAQKDRRCLASLKALARKRH